MSDAHAVARDQLRAFIERIERLEEEKKTIADDIKDVYGEAKGTGFDTKVLRKLISIRKQDRDERAEQEAILDMYMIALGMVAEPAGYDEPRQSAPVQRQPAMALRADGGLRILTKHEDIRKAPVTADEICRPANPAVSGGEPSIPSTDAGGEKMDGSSHPGRPDATTLGIISTKSGQATNSHSEMDRATEGSFETGSEAAEKGRKATATVAAPADLNHAGAGESSATDCEIDPSEDREEGHSDDGNAAANAGGDHVDGGALRANRDENGEGAANIALPDKPKHRLRPNCLDRSNCKSGSIDHCWSCKKAMAEKSGVAA